MRLFCDPSARAFGWILFDEDEIVDYGVFDALGSFKGTEAKSALEITRNIKKEFDKYITPRILWLQTICPELPIGSQSSRAAWYLSAVQSAVWMYAKENEVEFIGIPQNIAKFNVHGHNGKTPKDATIKFVVDYLPKYSYILDTKVKKESTSSVQPKKAKEALADTLAIYYTLQKLEAQ
jgi:hypothetical protein